MSGWLRRLAAVGALIVVTGLLALPLARGSSPGPGSCHCPVKMACCESGACHRDEPRSDAPVWKSCADEPGDPAAPPPSQEAPLPRVCPSAPSPPAVAAGRQPDGPEAALRRAPSPPPPERSAAVRLPT